MQVTKAGLQRVHYVTILLCSYSEPAVPAFALGCLLSWPVSSREHKYGPRGGSRCHGFCSLCIKQNAPPASEPTGRSGFRRVTLSRGVCLQERCCFCLQAARLPVQSRPSGRALGATPWVPRLIRGGSALRCWPALASDGGAGGDGRRWCRLLSGLEIVLLGDVAAQDLEIGGVFLDALKYGLHQRGVEIGLNVCKENLFPGITVTGFKRA